MNKRTARYGEHTYAIRVPKEARAAWELSEEALYFAADSITVRDGVLMLSVEVEPMESLAWIIHGGRSERRRGTRAARPGDCWRDGGGPSTVGLLRGRRCSVISEMVGEEAVSGDLRARLHAGQVVLREDLCYQFPSAVHSRLVEDRL